MKVRATLVLDFEFSDQEAHEKFGAYDPATVAQSMQAEVDEGFNETFRNDHHVTHASCTVHPLYG